MRRDAAAPFTPYDSMQARCDASSSRPIATELVVMAHAKRNGRRDWPKPDAVTSETIDFEATASSISTMTEGADRCTS